MTIFGNNNIKALSSRLSRIEAKLDLLLDHMGVEIPDRAESLHEKELIARIRDILTSAGKIEAIKAYRGETGAGLKESKDFVDSL